MAESWTKARGRSTSIADWQLRQAVDAARILACDVLAIPWAPSFPWQSLADQARSLEAEHRTLSRETIQVRAGLPIVAGASRLQSVPGATPSGGLQSDLHTLIAALRRAVRLKDRAVTTEETYVYWNRRFIRFCHLKLRQSPQAAGPPAITAYLDFLALERNVAPATQKQALNAMAFLMKNVLGIEEFTLDHITPACGQRRPPVVMTREEVRSVVAHFEDPWKLAAAKSISRSSSSCGVIFLFIQKSKFNNHQSSIHLSLPSIHLSPHAAFPAPGSIDDC